MRDRAQIDKTLTFPLSARLSAEQILRLNVITAQMNTSTGKFLSAILEDVLPLFDKGGDAPVTIRLAKLYKVMKDTDMLQAINVENEKRKLLARGEGQPRGRPRKEA
jgi:uncharacterized protein YjgD (DUF1641 family)